MFTIQPFQKTAAEYEAIIKIANTVWPEEPKTAAQVKRHDEGRHPDFLFQRLLVEVNGQIVGYGVYGENAWSYQPGKYFIELTILPAYQKRGLGTALYQHIFEALASREPAPKLLTTGAREDKVEAIAFLVKRGFSQVMRAPSSKLDLTTFEPARFAGVVEKVRQSGISIYSMTELKKSAANWKRIWYDLECEINRDHPAADEGEDLPFETFAGYLDSPLVSTDAYFIAVDGRDKYVGLSGLFMNQADPKIFNTEMTGVVRSHRRRGIATALKVRAIMFARERGGKVIYTGNEEHNPMYQLNLKLGFTPGPAWLSFHHKLSTAAAADPTHLAAHPPPN